MSDRFGRLLDAVQSVSQGSSSQPLGDWTVMTYEKSSATPGAETVFLGRAGCTKVLPSPGVVD